MANTTWDVDAAATGSREATSNVVDMAAYAGGEEVNSTGFGRTLFPVRKSHQSLEVQCLQLQ